MDDSTLPPAVQKADAVAKSVWQWSMAHTMFCSHALAFVAGFIIAKMVS